MTFTLCQNRSEGERKSTEAKSHICRVGAPFPLGGKKI